MACGGMTAAMPAAPSAVVETLTTPAAPAPAPAQNFPLLTGRWRTSGRIAFRNLETGNILSWGCSGSFTVTTQDGGAFSGPFDTQGSGWNTDRFCTASGTLRGELVAPNGSVARARLEGNSRNWPRPSVSPACEVVSAGDGIWNGSATGDAIALQIGDILRCAPNVDGGLAPTAMADFERTVTLTFERW